MELNSKYDEIARFEARRDQEDPWVMYLIVRDSLGMGAGKVGAQCGHAVGKLYDYYERLNADCNNQWADKRGPEWDEKFEMRNAFSSWKDDSFRKVVLKAKESKWEKLKEGLVCTVVRDAGLTEVASGSETVLGVWPMRKSERPQLIKKLQTLK
jgi:PTH2 family peptidyl-tRNA hydrolase